MKKILAFIIILGLIVGGIFFALKMRTSNDISTLYKDFSLIIDDEIMNKEDFDRIDGQFYLSLDLIKSKIDDKVFYDDNEKTLIFTNDKGTKRFTLGDSEGTIEDKTVGVRDPIIEKDGKILVPIEIFIYDYPVDLRYIKDLNLLVMDYNNHTYIKGTPVSSNVKLRDSSSNSSPIIKNLTEEDEVYVYSENSNWYKVRMVNGYAGYIRKKDLKVNFSEDKYKISLEDKKKEAFLKGPLNLTWDYTYGKVSDATINSIRPLPGVNVICPTWFSVTNKEGDIFDRGNIEYVKRYNDLGIDVWGYLDNSFNAELTHEFLSSSKVRKRIIDNLLTLVKKYNMKGINIDFEQTKIDDRDLITQFVRELYPVFKNEGILVSVDVTPQISSNVLEEPYNRKELAETADYIMVMAYDQHWSSSPKAGSVAEYKWVEGNINVLLRQIPRDKFILCLPLYSRIWTEENGSTKSVVASMVEVNNYVNRNNLAPTWDDNAKQMYAENQSNGKINKVWIEDADSLKWKSSLLLKYNLGGVASWRKGFETPNIWTVIDENLKAQKN